MATKIKLLVNNIINKDIRELVDEGYDVNSITRIMHITGVEMRGLNPVEVSKRAIWEVV